MCLCRYRSEVQRLRNVFRSAVAGDVARLKEAVGEYKENTSRLECQKQLLLKQASMLCRHHVHRSNTHNTAIYICHDSCNAHCGNRDACYGGLHPLCGIHSVCYGKHNTQCPPIVVWYCSSCQGLKP